MSTRNIQSTGQSYGNVKHKIIKKKKNDFDGIGVYYLQRQNTSLAFGITYPECRNSARKSGLENYIYVVIYLMGFNSFL